MLTEVTKNWSEMTPQERREQRLQTLLRTEDKVFESPDAEAAYRARMQRLIDAYSVREPDVVPVNLPIGNMAAYSAGLSYHDLMYRPEMAVGVAERFKAETGIDAAKPSAVPGPVLDLLDYKQYQWPGHGAGLEAPGYQFVEGEYMQADEYDRLIRDPSDFWLRVYYPRIFGALEPLRMLHPATDVTEIVQVVTQFRPLANPEVRAALQRLIDVGSELQRWIERTGVGLPSPTIGNTFAKAPFDTIGDTLRGTKGIFLDMQRQPEKLLRALDVVAEVSIANAIELVNESGGAIAMFPLHKGADGWMSQKQFDTFYWPSLSKVIWGLIEEGIQVVLFAEGSYDTRLESVNEFPKGAVAWLFDRTDMARAKQILGDKCCISGNVPASLLKTGKPEQVKEYCRGLIEACAPGGGYILAGGSTQAEGVPLENLKAMLAAAEEFGQYRRLWRLDQAPRRRDRRTLPGLGDMARSRRRGRLGIRI